MKRSEERALGDFWFTEGEGKEGKGTWADAPEELLLPPEGATSAVQQSSTQIGDGSELWGLSVKVTKDLIEGEGPKEW